VVTLSYGNEFKACLPVPVYVSEVPQVPRHHGVTCVAPCGQRGNCKPLIERDVQVGDGELQGNSPVYRQQRLKRLFHPSRIGTGFWVSALSSSASCTRPSSALDRRQLNTWQRAAGTMRYKWKLSSTAL